jgi:hypothetical protein
VAASPASAEQLTAQVQADYRGFRERGEDRKAALSLTAIKHDMHWATIAAVVAPAPEQKSEAQA